ncbi:TetR/AcrR family transcriptional regulator [Acinetobacter calcoaceticus]|uniref:TetR/AcrR family transcriptional regulator n=1 Tax=Acinetobacter calcoaceticus TaxID=471 RepID=UPI0018FF4554|nr:TetR/AcrR family transcriptional regulator [Acinetobacter calcoaceticus]MBJ9722563.1 TetR/AcrR family transcriptional regulator [Acinetobacter calcoaceticus]
MVSTKKTHPQLTREKILGAAIHLFQRHGFSGLGMRQIADCLQIKAPSLYYHFESKDDLARGALQQYREEQASQLREIEKLDGLTEKLHAYSELFAEMLNDQNRLCLYLVMVREASFQQEPCLSELRLFAKQNIDWLEDIFYKAKKDLPQSIGSERNMAEIVFASLEGIMATSLIDENPCESFRSRTRSLINITLFTTTQ